MSRIRRIIRKTPPSATASFDERLWPVNAALVVLGGFLAGVVLAHFGFQDRRWYANAATWLIAIALALTIVMMGVRRLSGRTVRRATQLALVVSVLVHVMLIVVAVNTGIFARIWVDEPRHAPPTRARHEEKVPEYVFPGAEAEGTRDFEKPLATETPDADTAALQERLSEPESPSFPPQLASAEPPDQPVPSHPLERRPPVATAPRSGEQSSQLSRHVTPAPLLLDPLAEAPAQASRPTRPPPRPQPAPEDLEPARTSAQLGRNDRVATPPEDDQPGEPPLARRAVEQRRPAPTDSSPAAVSRRSAAVGPRSIMESTPPSPAPEPPGGEPQPRSLAAGPRPSAAAPSRPPMASGPPRWLADRAAPSLARSPAAAESQSPPALMAAADRLRERAQQSRLPAPAPSEIQGRTPPRVEGRAVIPSSPAPVDSPANYASDQPMQDLAAAPARTALAKGQAGVEGIGQTVNLDRGREAPESPAPAPSGAARRPRATQRTPRGGEIAPAEPALVSRSRAESLQPSTTLRAEPGESPTARGADAPMQRTTTSSAQQLVQRAKAGVAEITADKGWLETDTGPHRVVSEQAGVRAAGGGQPEIAAETQPRPVVRSQSGGRPLAAIVALQAAELPATPTEVSGGQPGDTISSSGPAPAELQPAPSPQTAVARAAVSAEPQQAPSGNVAALPADAPRRESRDDASLASSVGPDAAVPRTPRAAELVQPTLLDGAVRLVADQQTAERPAAAPSLDAPVLGPPQAAPDGPRGEKGGTSGQPERVAIESAPAPGVAATRRAQREQQSAWPAATADGSARVARSWRSAEPQGTPLADAPILALRQDPAGGEGNVLEDRWAAASSPTERIADESISVEMFAVEGPGGLASQWTPRVGLSDRRAQQDSLHVPPQPARFVRHDVGAEPRVNTVIALPSPAFVRRTARTRRDAELGLAVSPGPETEEAIERGLVFLAGEQRSSGGWTLNRADEQVALVSDTAATGLALLAFLGAGYHHREHKYEDVVAAGIAYLLDHQKDNGDLYLDLDGESSKAVWLYSHSIAALALCEAFGMTQDPQLREPAQRALDYVAAAQHPLRGGWRYSPQFGADTSVTGWMTMALKSGDLANLDVSPATYAGIRRWLESAQASPDEPHLYCYNPFAPDTPAQRHGRTASKSMTAVGLLMRLYLDWRRDHPGMIRGAQYLASQPPMLGGVQDPQRDTYYWYYATQVMFHMGGEYWRSWNERLHPLLVDSQIGDGPLAGSWDPYRPVPDRWAPHAGRLYVTAMNLLSLEVYYRLLPLYEDTAK